MLEKLRKIMTILFVALTIMSASTVVYSAYFYFGIYRATSTLDMSIEDFHVIFLNATDAYTETILSFSNPSEYEFRSVMIGQRLDLAGQYVGYANPSKPTSLDPLRLLPRSRTNATVNFEIPPHKMELLESTPQKQWALTVNVVCEGPIVERFTLNDFAVFTIP